MAVVAPPLPLESRMNAMPSTPAPLSSPGPLLLAGIIVLAALSRLLPHPPNFSPVEALALFGGAYFASRSAAIVVPLLAMLLSDFALAVVNGGFYAEHFMSVEFLLVYACIAASAVLGFGLRGKARPFRIAGYSVLGSVLFFLVTNFGTWLGSGMYPLTGSGLAAAYVAGLPFFQNTLAGTLVYAALMFGGFAWLRARNPRLQWQTA